MRLNVYTEELPNNNPMPNCEIVEAKYINSRTGLGMTNYGLRIYLKSHPDLHFIEDRDDDRSAVTFWCGSKLKNVHGFIDMLRRCYEIDNLARFRKVVAKANEASAPDFADRSSTEDIVHVVMSNDYPDSVFLKADTASAYCAAKDIEEMKKDGKRIHWRSYPIEVRDGKKA